MPGKGREGLPQLEGLRLRPPRVLGGGGTALPECLSGSFWDPGGYRRSLWVSGRLQS